MRRQSINHESGYIENNKNFSDAGNRPIAQRRFHISLFRAGDLGIHNVFCMIILANDIFSSVEFLSFCLALAFVLTCLRQTRSLVRHETQIKNPLTLSAAMVRASIFRSMQLTLILSPGIYTFHAIGVFLNIASDLCR